MSELKVLQGKVFLLTGATGNLGSVTAQQLACEGATVVLLGKKLPQLERLYDRIIAADGACPAIYALNLEGATPNDYEQLANSLEKEFGRLDGIIHAAAYFVGLSSLEHTEPEEWLRGLHINLTAPLMLTRACLGMLRKQADATVVFLINRRQESSKPFWGAYGVAQEGLRGVVQILGKELENSSVHAVGLELPPMLGALRSRAFVSDTENLLRPEAVAKTLVSILGANARSHRGGICELDSLERTVA